MRQQRALEGEFESNYEKMAKLYANPLAELNRVKKEFAPNGRLSAEELREVVKEVDQTETAARPYAFVKFDTVIQRTKRQYADARAQRNLDRLQAELSEV